MADYTAKLKELLRANLCRLERQGKGDHEIWYSPITEIRFPVDGKIKSRHTANAVLFESEVERAFAEAKSKREDIKLFIKLPGWFKIETPIGAYNPDWAIVKQGDAKVYLVRETKSTKDQLKLRGSGWAKIQCGKAHFDTLQVDFAHVVSANEA